MTRHFNGLKPSTTSFFPTARELTTSIKWIKDHPLVATAVTAAATAASVIAYLKNDQEEEEEEEDNEFNHIVSWEDEYGQCLHCSLENQTSSCQCHQYRSKTHQIQLPMESNQSLPQKNQNIYHAPPNKKISRIPSSLHSNLMEGSKEMGPSSMPIYRSLKEESEYQPMSPQWGWYVSITPPTDSSFIINGPISNHHLR